MGQVETCLSRMLRVHVRAPRPDKFRLERRQLSPTLAEAFSRSAAMGRNPSIFTPVLIVGCVVIMVSFAVRA